MFSDTSPLPLPRAAPNHEGKIPPEIGKLAALTTLWLENTKISGRFVGVVIGPFFIIISRLRLTETSTLNHASFGNVAFLTTHAHAGRLTDHFPSVCSSVTTSP